MDPMYNLFQDIKFITSGNVSEDVVDLLKQAGAYRLFYHSTYATHVIYSDEPLETDIEDAKEYGIPVVRSRWVLLCAQLKRLVSPTAFVYEPRKLFSKVVVCVSKLPQDLETIWALVTYHGGEVQLNLDGRCTHLVTADCRSRIYKKALGCDVAIVTPDWIVESVRAKALHEIDSYHPRFLDNLDEITGFAEEVAPPEAPMDIEKHTTLLMEWLQKQHDPKEECVKAVPSIVPMNGVRKLSFSTHPTESGAPVVVSKAPTHSLEDESRQRVEMKFLKKIQGTLSGVFPPPNLTTVQISVNEMLDRINQNTELFWSSIASASTSSTRKSLLITDTPDSIHKQWPEIITSKFHGLHYNHSKISEEVEHLCTRYAERYVGAETQSSCTIFDPNLVSPSKRRSSKPKWGSARSPGRRLSHLARRRITFSSANLQSSSSSAILGSRARQILVDTKKLNMLNKKKTTPTKSPFKVRKRTPSSSAKKKLALRFRQMSEELENIPSQENQRTNHSFLAMEKKATKRNLFASSPAKASPKKSPFKLLNMLDRKRKLSDSEDLQPSKLARTSDGLKARLEDSQLSDVHKKKLQWAVYEALRVQNITASHPQFKVFASVLARVTRKLLPGAGAEGRTSEKMFRIARYHSFAVVKGKSVDEIVNEYLKSKPSAPKPQGYVGIEEFNNVKNVSRIDRIKKVISFEENGK